MTVDASGLESERHLLERSGTAERVAAILRQYITDGVFAPGERLSEPVISSALGVSRNTLRESFQLLAHERLAVPTAGQSSAAAAARPSRSACSTGARSTVDRSAARRRAPHSVARRTT